MVPFNSFFLIARGLDFHDNDLQFVTTSGAVSYARQVNVTEIIARFIFPNYKRHPTLLSEHLCFSKQGQVFMHVFMQLYNLYSADIFRVSWKYNDLVSGESWLARKWQFNHTLVYFQIRGRLAAGIINVSGVIFFLLP